MLKLPPKTSSTELVQVGVITSPFGLRGEVFVFPMTDVETTSHWFNTSLCDQHGEPRFSCKLKHVKGKQLVIAIEGINNRTQAEALQKQALYIPRSHLPELEQDHFYYHDLRDLDAYDPDGKPLGKLICLQDFGAEPIMEVLLAGETHTRYYPFTRDIATDIDLENRRLTLVLPDEVQ